jgi:mono/diheme cytochrome c family protein
MLFRALRVSLAIAACSLFSAITHYHASASALSLSRMTSGQADLALHLTRSSPLDLEIGGDLAGSPSNRVRYLTREDLLQFPQVTYTVTDDPNFAGPVQIRGVELDVLARALSSDVENTVIVAISSDDYRAHYPQSYLQAHRPVLVLEVNGQPPAGWPRSREGTGSAMGPYLISQPHFTPSFRILSHSDEPQIPWGVLRLDFRSAQAVFGPITPRGADAADPRVQAGFRIAQQNCLRCHGPETEPHLKGFLTWSGIALFAATSQGSFAAYVRNPQAQAQYAKMPGNPNYDDATIEALIMYFRTFALQEKQ